MLRSITSALSVTAAAATNWFASGSAELATREIDYFAYIGYNATDGVVLGYARIPYARLYSDFSATSTNEKFARISTITNAVAGDNYVNVGRFAATLSAGAGYTWTVPTFTNANLIQEPTYRTRLLTYTTQFTAAGGGSFTSAIRIQRYEIIENKCFIQWETNAHTISGTVSSIDFSLPFTSADEISNGFQFGVLGFSLVSGQIIKGETQGAGTLIRFAPTSGNWAATAGAGYLGIKDVYTI